MTTPITHPAHLPGAARTHWLGSAAASLAAHLVLVTVWCWSCIHAEVTLDSPVFAATTTLMGVLVLLAMWQRWQAWTEAPGAHHLTCQGTTAPRDTTPERWLNLAGSALLLAAAGWLATQSLPDVSRTELGALGTLMTVYPAASLAKTLWRHRGWQRAATDALNLGAGVAMSVAAGPQMPHLARPLGWG